MGRLVRRKLFGLSLGHFRGLIYDLELLLGFVFLALLRFLLLLLELNVLHLVVIGALAGLGGVHRCVLLLVQERGDKLSVIVDLHLLVLDDGLEVLISQFLGLQLILKLLHLIVPRVELPLPVLHLAVRPLEFD